MKNREYKKYEQYNEEEIMALYSSVGWANYTNNPEMLRSAYENSLYKLSAYEEGKLVGIIRVIGDGHSIIYIQDIIVHPDFQRLGIGRELLKRVLEHFKDVYQKILLTENEEKTCAFYKSLGFKADNELGLVSFCQFGL